jgi:hypothetical protein
MSATPPPALVRDSRFASPLVDHLAPQLVPETSFITRGPTGLERSMATYKQGSSQDLLQTLSSYLGFPTHGAARALQQLLTQRREVLLNPLSKKVCFAVPITGV